MSDRPIAQKLRVVVRARRVIGRCVSERIDIDATPGRVREIALTPEPSPSEDAVSPTPRPGLSEIPRHRHWRCHRRPACRSPSRLPPTMPTLSPRYVLSGATHRRQVADSPLKGEEHDVGDAKERLGREREGGRRGMEGGRGRGGGRGVGLAVLIRPRIEAVLPC